MLQLWNSRSKSVRGRFPVWCHRNGKSTARFHRRTNLLYLELIAVETSQVGPYLKCSGPCTTSDRLLTKFLRSPWRFEMPDGVADAKPMVLDGVVYPWRQSVAGGAPHGSNCQPTRSTAFADHGMDGRTFKISNPVGRKVIDNMLVRWTDSDGVSLAASETLPLELNWISISLRSLWVSTSRKWSNYDSMLNRRGTANNE